MKTDPGRSALPKEPQALELQPFSAKALKSLIVSIGKMDRKLLPSQETCPKEMKDVFSVGENNFLKSLRQRTPCRKGLFDLLICRRADLFYLLNFD